jgi:hypothetical protein
MARQTEKMGDEATRRGMQDLKENASGLQLQPALPAGLPVSPPHRPKSNGAACISANVKPRNRKRKIHRKKPKKTRGKLPIHPRPQRPVGHHTRLGGRSRPPSHRPSSAHRSPYRAQPKQAWRACPGPGSHITWRGQGT